ncbi:MAG: hypothetical protein NT004_08870 [Bacteroidetes bacterium]|nr:hypothetical protein [Bacteroidota bacterium]
MKWNLNNRLPQLLIVLFAFLLYGNTLFYDYTLDDLMVVKENKFTVKGFSGIPAIFSYDSFTGFFGKEKKLVVGGRYRPLSIATFAVEYALVGGFNPFLSHLINILLYALTGIFIFLILKKLTNSQHSSTWLFTLPFITAILFLVHPIHTEVVANIKGRDEILSFLFSLISLWLVLVFLNKQKLVYLILANLSFFFGLLSKENAIVFVLLIPLTLYYFTKAPIRQNLSLGISLFCTACIFVFIRFLVLGYLSGGKLPDELLNNPFLEASTSQKYGAIFYTLGLYIKLLFFPLSLTHDYYPYHIPLIPFFDLKSLIPLIIYIFLIGYSFVKAPTKSWLSYSILLYLLPLFIVSNLLFPVGTFMNERFVYMSSFGFVLILAWFVMVKLPMLIKDKIRYSKVAAVILLTVILLFSLRTVLRNEVWKDNFTLFTSDVLVSRNSVKCNIAAGGELMKKAETETDSIKKQKMYQLSFSYLEKAIGLYPKATNGLILYGNAIATHRKDLKLAITQYLKVLAYNPYEDNAFGNTLKVLNSIDNAQESDYKISIYSRLFAINPNNSDVNYSLGKIYGQYKGNLDTASYFLERSIQFSPDYLPAYKDLGIVYSLKRNYQKALSTFSQAQKFAPNDQEIKKNITTTLQIMQKN